MVNIKGAVVYTSEEIDYVLGRQAARINELDVLVNDFKALLGKADTVVNTGNNIIDRVNDLEWRLDNKPNTKLFKLYMNAKQYIRRNLRRPSNAA